MVVTKETMYIEKNVPHCYAVLHKPHMDCPKITPKPLW
jgi:hypothetical protein